MAIDTITVASAQITDGSVATADIADDAVTTAKLGSVTDIASSSGAMTLSPAGTEIINVGTTGDIIVKGQGSSRAALILRAGSNTANSQIQLGDQASDTIGRVMYDHASDFMRFDTAGAERFRTSASGIHIGGTGAANALDDYEVGSWVPTIKNEGDNNLNVGYVSAYTHGRYVKLGPVVQFQMTININSLSGDSSQILICNNMPFTAKTYETNSNGGCKVTYHSNLDQDMTGGLMLGNSANMRFRYGNNNFQSQHLQGSSWFQMYGQYETAS